MSFNPIGSPSTGDRRIARRVARAGGIGGGARAVEVQCHKALNLGVTDLDHGDAAFEQIARRIVAGQNVDTCSRKPGDSGIAGS